MVQNLQIKFLQNWSSFSEWNKLLLPPTTPKVTAMLNVPTKLQNQSFAYLLINMQTIGTFSYLLWNLFSILFIPSWLVTHLSIFTLGDIQLYQLILSSALWTNQWYWLMTMSRSYKLRGRVWLIGFERRERKWLWNKNNNMTKQMKEHTLCWRLVIKCWRETNQKKKRLWRSTNSITTKKFMWLWRILRIEVTEFKNSNKRRIQKFKMFRI